MSAKRSIRALLLGAAFIMTAGQALAGEEPKPASTEPVKEKLICKSKPDTGSLVKRTKKCYTRAEWSKLDRATTDGANDMVDRNRGMMTNGN